MNPKVHLILCDSIHMLWPRKGIAYIEESRHERAHQFQSKDKDQFKKVSDQDQAHRYKACEQEIRNDLRINAVQYRVKKSSSRKRKSCLKLKRRRLDYLKKENKLKEKGAFRIGSRR